MESSNEESIADNDQTMGSSPVNQSVTSPKECQCDDHIFRESEHFAVLLTKSEKCRAELEKCRKQKNALVDDNTELKEKLEICEERVKQHKMDAERALSQVAQKDQMLAYTQDRLNRKLAAVNRLTDQNNKLRQQQEFTNGTSNCSRRSKSVVNDHRFMNDPRTKARPTSRNPEEELQPGEQNEENISQSDQTLKQVRKEFPQVLSERSNDLEASKALENNLRINIVMLQAQITADKNTAQKRENESMTIINNLKATNARIEGELEDIKSKFQQSEAALAESRQKEQQSAEQRMENNKIQAQIRAKIEQLTVYISKTDKALNDTKQKLSEANIKLEKQQAMETYLNLQLEERYKDLEQMKQQLEMYQQKFEDSEQKCKDYEKALITSKNDTEVLEELNAILKRGNSELADKVATSERKVFVLEQTFENVGSENDPKIAKLEATTVCSTKQITGKDVASPANDDLHRKLGLKEQDALELKKNIDNLTLMYNQKEATLQKVAQRLAKCAEKLKEEKEFGMDICDKLGKCSAELQASQQKCAVYKKKLKMLETEKSLDSAKQHKDIVSNGNMQVADDLNGEIGSSHPHDELERDSETKVQLLQQTLAECETKIAKLEDERRMEGERNAKQLEELRQSLDQSKKDIEKAVKEKNSIEEAVAQLYQRVPLSSLKRKRPLAETEQESGSQDEMPKRIHTDDQNEEEINKEDENSTGACTSQTEKDPLSASIPAAVCDSINKGESNRVKLNRTFDSSPQSIHKLPTSSRPL
ncbi:hypothetical protein DdX_10819 [Ditylenchus destructor]|uniref:Uncharacterized protein n=1 Tax=Ditylenchus destructor TaxID=166010 RepID=A0AAD4N1X8_9BILA|nr:hypothetical protein DdX_10819 [Ditylenchus destructor]